MKCIKCKRDKDTGRVCVHGYHRIVEETSNYTRYEQQGKLEPLFICQDCIRKSLSKFHQFGCTMLPVYLLVLLGSVYALVTMINEPAYIPFFGFFAFIGLIGTLGSVDIIRNIHTEKYIHQRCFGIVFRYIDIRSFKESFSSSKTAKHMNTGDMLWFETAGNGVRYLGHAIKKGKKLVPSADPTELRQAKEAVVEELLKQNDLENAQ